MKQQGQNKKQGEKEITIWDILFIKSFMIIILSILFYFYNDNATFILLIIFMVLSFVEIIYYVIMFYDFSKWRIKND